ncbi:MAG: DUF401 family protein [candidate division Zixibacteria bacterium]|nr:DUF401 family protein [candidate division Zixibacteria bacterium]
MESLRLGLILVSIIVALRRKIPIGITLMAVGPFTALIYLIPLDSLLVTYRDVALSHRFISLTGLIVLATIMGSLLKDLGFLDRMADACQNLRGGNKAAVVILPPLIGVMPMPGGSLMSAPLVNSLMSDKQYTPHFKCATNYWFRHLIELTWPIYPGIILTEAVTGMPVYKISLLQSPLTVAMLIVGLFVFIRPMGSQPSANPSIAKAVIGIIGSIWPVIIAVTLYGAFKVELSLSLLIANLCLVVVAHPTKKIMASAIKQGLSIKMLMFIYGVLSFQSILELSGGMESIPKLATEYHLPEGMIIFSVCFLIGFLTGMISAYVGLGFTLLAGLLYQPELIPNNIMLASLSGFTGFLISPAHLCVVVTSNYFGCDVGSMIKKVILPLGVVFAVGVVLYLLDYGSLFE